MLSRITYLTVKAKREEHKEEENGPQLGGRHVGKGFRIRDEGKTVSTLGHVCKVAEIIRAIT